MAVNALDPILWTESIITAWDAATNLVAIVPNVWYGQAEQREAYPYCVLHVISNVPAHMFSGAVIEIIRVQFSLFDNQGSHARLSTALAQMYIYFDGATLTPSDVSRFSHMGMQRVAENPPRWTAENVWQADIDYRVEFFRTAS